jgi:undecaprenyl-diphosphatase
MIPTYQAVTLGVVQGLSEFLPISSSAHLILVPWAAGWSDPGLAFDVALHLGTLLALLAYFWKDWFSLAKDALVEPGESLLLKLAWGTLPAAVVGLAFKHQIETALRAPWIGAVLLAGFGLLLGYAERQSSKTLETGAVSWNQALAVGAAQALALMPGVSRSGVTMTAALLLGMNSAAAARFSFLLATPAMFGAGLVEGRHILKLHETIGAPFFAAILTSAVVGAAVIHYFLAYLKRRSLKPFVVYRVLLGASILLLYIAGRAPQ